MRPSLDYTSRTLKSRSMINEPPNTPGRGPGSAGAPREGWSYRFLQPKNLCSTDRPTTSGIPTKKDDRHMQRARSSREHSVGEGRSYFPDSSTKGKYGSWNFGGKTDYISRSKVNVLVLVFIYLTRLIVFLMTRCLQFGSHGHDNMQNCRQLTIHVAYIIHGLKFVCKGIRWRHMKFLKLSHE